MRGITKVRCYFCNQLLNENREGPCPYCGGSLENAGITIIENGRIVDLTENEGYLFNGGITMRQMEGYVTFKSVESQQVFVNGKWVPAI